MPVDVESELARLGAAWTASVAHVEVAEVLERTMPARSGPPTIEAIDVMAEPPARDRGGCLPSLLWWCSSSPRMLLAWCGGTDRVSRRRRPRPRSPRRSSTVGWPSLRPRRHRGRPILVPATMAKASRMSIWFGKDPPQRITGSDTDLTDEICPAFSPDGRGWRSGKPLSTRTRATPAMGRW